MFTGNIAASEHSCGVGSIAAAERGIDDVQLEEVVDRQAAAIAVVRLCSPTSYSVSLLPSQGRDFRCQGPDSCPPRLPCFNRNLLI